MRQVVLDRRHVLRASPALGLGITTVALPAAAVAASLNGTTLATTGPATITVDDTGTPSAGHDVALAVRLVGSDGGPETGNIRVDITVRRDDGSNAGAGSTASGTRIDGVEQSTVALLSDSGSVDVSVDLPSAGTYLFAVTTSPAATNQPDGVVLAYVFGG